MFTVRHHQGSGREYRGARVEMIVLLHFVMIVIFNKPRHIHTYVFVYVVYSMTTFAHLYICT